MDFAWLSKNARKIAFSRSCTSISQRGAVGNTRLRWRARRISAAFGVLLNHNFRENVIVEHYKRSDVAAALAARQEVAHQVAQEARVEGQALGVASGRRAPK
jgi:hypothetical protein